MIAPARPSELFERSVSTRSRKSDARSRCTRISPTRGARPPGRNTAALVGPEGVASVYRKSHAFISDERMKQAYRIGPAADACHHCTRQLACCGKNLFARFASDDALEIANHQRVRMRSKRTAQQVVSVVDVRHPIA